MSTLFFLDFDLSFATYMQRVAADQREAPRALPCLSFLRKGFDFDFSPADSPCFHGCVRAAFAL
jgi:hypothetical protein